MGFRGCDVFLLSTISMNFSKFPTIYTVFVIERLTFELSNLVFVCFNDKLNVRNEDTGECFGSYCCM